MVRAKAAFGGQQVWGPLSHYLHCRLTRYLPGCHLSATNKADIVNLIVLMSPHLHALNVAACS